MAAEIIGHFLIESHLLTPCLHTISQGRRSTAFVRGLSFMNES